MKICTGTICLLLFASLFIGGCKKNKDSSDCFKLKAVYLYQGSNTACASNIWQVEESPDIEITPGSYVDFVTDQSDYPTNIKIDDVIYIKLKMKVMIVPGIDRFCPLNYTYLLQGDFCR
jgi:hypothetical protein